MGSDEIKEPGWYVCRYEGPSVFLYHMYHIQQDSQGLYTTNEEGEDQPLEDFEDCQWTGPVNLERLYNG